MNSDLSMGSARPGAALDMPHRMSRPQPRVMPYGHFSNSRAGIKRLVEAAVCALIIAGCGRNGSVEEKTGARKQKELISVSGAWALYPLMVQWAAEYCRHHPATRIDVTAGGAGKGVTDVLAGAVDIAMVSREVHQEEIERGAWTLPVVKDAVVVTVNTRNPALNALAAKGISSKEAAGIWKDAAITNWRQTGVEFDAPLRAYTRSDACGASETFAAWFGARQEEIRGVAVYGDPGIAEAVRRDVMGIGYNNIAFAYDRSTGKPVEGLSILPLDADCNGKADPDELVVEDLRKLTAAVAAGKYPSPPARTLYLILKGPPVRAEIIGFLNWILAEGQGLAADSGYIPLDNANLADARRKLTAR